jgi:hypothetical protein
MAAKKTSAVRGGEARARVLSKKERSDIARSAALSRWSAEGKDVPVLAMYGAPDRPLRIGNVEIPCYVLADGRRVLAQRGLNLGIGLSEGGGRGGERKLAVLMAFLEERGVNTRGLIARANAPFRFIPPHGGNQADGYEASILTDICAVLIEAGLQGKLHARQTHLAERAALLQHGFAEVGINALVDEATGYQEHRARDALAKILERFVEKELRPWVRTFPPEYYKQIYRLSGWDYDPERNLHPGVMGHWTNNIVYRRLAPGVLSELRKLVKKDDKGRLKAKLFQGLTEDFGHPRLREHLAGVVMLMKYSDSWDTFWQRLDHEYPQFGDTIMLPFPPDYPRLEAAGE